MQARSHYYLLQLITHYLGLIVWHCAVDVLVYQHYKIIYYQILFIFHIKKCLLRACYLPATADKKEHFREKEKSRNDVVSGFE